MKKKWKMGLVGVGGAGRSAAYMHHPQIEVTAIFDPDTKALEEAGKELSISDNERYEKYEEFLNSDIDVVMIGSPMPFHAQQTIDALEADKHVLCEVTAATTVEDCFRIIKAVERTGKIYMMAENTVYFHFLHEWKLQAREGLFGTVFHAEGEYLSKIRQMVVDPVTGEKYWRNDRPPLHYCSHSLGPILEIMDDRIVKATGHGTSKTIIPEGGVGAIDSQTALFETAKGATIKLLRSSVVAREPAVGHISLYGSKGQIENGRMGYASDGWIYIEDDPLYKDGAKRLPCPMSDPNAPEEAHIISGHGTAEYYLIRDFVKALNGEIAPPIDVYRAVEYTIPGIIAQQAVEQGNVWLDVPQVR